MAVQNLHPFPIMPTFITETESRQQAEQDLPGYLRQVLRREHPEWINEQGECPPCEEYEAKISHLFPAEPAAFSTAT